MSQRRWSIGVMTNRPIGLTAECPAIPRSSLATSVDAGPQLWRQLHRDLSKRCPEPAGSRSPTRATRSHGRPFSTFPPDSQVGLDEHVAISGFIVDGTGTKKVMLRAIGPSLSQFGIAGRLADPVLELHDQAGVLIGTNDNWQTTQLGGVITADQQAEILASTISPDDPAEAAIIANLESRTVYGHRPRMPIMEPASGPRGSLRPQPDRRLPWSPISAPAVMSRPMMMFSSAVLSLEARRRYSRRPCARLIA